MRLLALVQYLVTRSKGWKIRSGVFMLLGVLVVHRSLALWSRLGLVDEWWVDVDVTALEFPPQCNDSDLATILLQLPACNAQSGNDCATSYATRCPDNIWWEEQFLPPRAADRSPYRRTRKNRRRPSPRVAIYVGCNKGFDAVYTLRLLASDATFDRPSWSDALYQGEIPSKGYCGQHAGPQAKVGKAVGLVSDRTAVLHCIEPMPTTAAALSRTAQALHWQERYIVSNVALSNVDGTALFPNDVQNMGTESTSLGDCLNETSALQHCVSVPVYRLDTYLDEHFDDPDTTIDFLSIDAEGYDWEIIMGGVASLRRVKYLEFEYNSVPNWFRHNLSDAIATLTEHRFVCYWAGAYGHIWRISDCWMDHYNVHSFSNVACVNLNFAENAPLLHRMEELFRATLNAGSKISYRKPSSLYSDGGFRYPEFADMRVKNTRFPPPKDSE
jgi:FkbM family methyltransferase